ncbi:hypothetical protein Asp14428_58200 [Actinoplanes sp. NBRC 14428]|nr:hypothetical protein Asp14428_58200 [Actinoplanes sp. NBRC 14428]
MGAVTAEPRPWTAPVATGPVASAVRLPGSKSMTARALVLSALAGGPSEIRRPLRARDTTLMAAGLRALGVAVDTTGADAWTVVPGPLRGPATVDVGLAGTIMRFAPPVAALAEGTVTFDGDPHARNRPLRPIVEALRSLGVDIDASPSGGLPLVVRGTGTVGGGEAVIDASGSSQFVSGLLLSAPRFAKGLVLRHEGPPVPSAPHLRMTTHMLRAAGALVDESVPDVWTVEPGALSGRTWDIEPDLSGAAPFFAAAMVTGGAVTLAGWPRDSWQPAGVVTGLLTALGPRSARTRTGSPSGAPAPCTASTPTCPRSASSPRSSPRWPRSPTRRPRCAGWRTSAATRPTASPRSPASWAGPAPAWSSTPTGWRSPPDRCARPPGRRTRTTGWPTPRR